MKTEINKRVSEYRSKIADCDKLLESYRFEKTGLRDKARREDKVEATNATEQILRIKKDESIIEARRQCHVQAMHDFDSLLDMI